MVTSYSFLMTVLFSNIIMVLLFFCCKSTRVVGHVGLNPLLFGTVLCVIRTCLPMEFWFTKEINLPEVYNPIYEFLDGNVFESNVSIGMIAAAIWGTVSLILLLRLTVQYNRYRKFIKKLPDITGNQFTTTAKTVLSDRDRKRIRIAFTEPDGIPAMAGVFKPVILILMRSYKNKELEMILLHEYTHFKNRDILIKWIIEILWIIFWWYPAVYLFKRGLNAILEIRCDSMVTANRKESDVRYYFLTIVKIGEIQLGLRPAPRPHTTSGLLGDEELLQRINVVVQYRKRKHNRALAAVSLLTAMTLFLLSYSFVFQTFYEPPEEELTTSAGHTKADYYLTENKDGTYTIYENGKEQTVSWDEFLAWEKEEKASNR